MITVAGITLIAGEEPSGFVSKDGFVPNAEVAVKIAEAVLTPVYGQQQVISERPFNARLESEVWIVEGTLHCGAPHCDGGTAEVRISKRSGEIVRMTHGK